MLYGKCIVVVPCYNEENSIEATIAEIKLYVPGARILVIDNNSSDNTGAVARNLGATVIFEPTRGKGKAVQRAFTIALQNSFEVLLMLDGDDTYSLQNFHLAYEMVVRQNHDMVVGRRVLSNSATGQRRIAYRSYHKIGNSLLTKLNRILFGVNIEDTLSGWRALSSNFVRSFYGGNSGFEIESELNAHAFILSCSIANLDVEYRGRMEGSESKLNTFQDGFRILKMQLRLFKSERPNLAYSIMALPWGIVSIVLIRNVLVNYFELKEIPNFPSLIAGVGAFQVSIFLWATGIILNNLRLNRIQTVRMMYNNMISAKKS